MSIKMRYLALILIIYSGYASACIVGPNKMSADVSHGFIFKSKASALCNQCNMLTITAPSQFKNTPFSHGLFTLYSGGQIISRSIHSSINESGIPEFVGIVNIEKGLNY